MSGGCMLRNLLIFFLVLVLIPNIVDAQSKSNTNNKERVVLVTVEKVSEGMTYPTMMINEYFFINCPITLTYILLDIPN